MALADIVEEYVFAREALDEYPPFRELAQRMGLSRDAADRAYYRAAARGLIKREPYVQPVGPSRKRWTS